MHEHGEANFEGRLAGFVAIMQGLTDDDYKRNYPNQHPPRYEVDPKGIRYKRIVQQDLDADGHALRWGGSAHAFVDTTNGNVLYPAGYKGPAKHARGNIFADDNGRSALTGIGGIRLLR